MRRWLPVNSGHDNPACFSAGPCHVLPEKPQKPHPFLYSTVCPFMVDFASYRAMSAHLTSSSNEKLVPGTPANYGMVLRYPFHAYCGLSDIDIAAFMAVCIIY